MWFVSGERYHMLQAQCDSKELHIARLEARVQALEEEVQRNMQRLSNAGFQYGGMEKALKESELRNAQLVETLLTMKREGFQPTPNPSLPPMRETIDPAIENALHERAGQDPALFNRLLRNAHNAVNSGKSVKDVADGILNGSSINPFLL